MGVEGELQLTLRLAGGRIESLAVTSTRPDVAQSLLRGRSTDEIRAAVPRLFSLCGASQAAAGDLALAAAAGAGAVGAEMLAASTEAVTAEAIREGSLRVLLDWPRWIDEPLDDAAMAAARSAARPGAGTHTGMRTAADDPALERALFGGSAASWLAVQSAAELDTWLDAGRTASARFLRRLRDRDGAPGQRRQSAAALLATPLAASAAVEIAQAIDSDPGFWRAPTWRGRQVETGARARRRADPLIVAVEGRSNTRVPARLVARLRELARLLTGHDPMQVGACSTGPGTGIAWVENARGLLIHRARLDGGRACDYRIVAPTEWNFHPQGALASALVGSRAADAAEARRLALHVVHSLDPCVACVVEVLHA